MLSARINDPVPVPDLNITMSVPNIDPKVMPAEHIPNDVRGRGSQMTSCGRIEEGWADFHRRHLVAASAADPQWIHPFTLMFEERDVSGTVGGKFGKQR